MSQEHDDLARLFEQLEPDAAQRAARIEEHRLLESDLFRLGDPLPPSDFLAQVMRRVDAAPVRLTRADLSLATLVFGSSVGLGAMLLLRGGSIGSAGTAFAGFLVAARTWGQGALNAMAAIWGSAALPVTVVLVLVFGGSLALLKRVAGRLDSVKVLS